MAVREYPGQGVDRVAEGYGMSRKDVGILRWKHIKREWGKRKDALHIEFTRGKTKEYYETFLG